MPERDGSLSRIMGGLHLGQMYGVALEKRGQEGGRGLSAKRGILWVGREAMTLVKNDCYICEHKVDVPWNCHIQCNNPDPEMTGYPYGVQMGWFIYPFLFDPVWMTKKCSNYLRRNDERKLPGQASAESDPEGV